MERMALVDYEVILSARAGDMFSMGQVLGAYGSIVEGMIRKSYPRLPDDAVQDCKQEMYIVLMEAVSKFRPD